jgi:nitrile hydratase beta subunit
MNGVHDMGGMHGLGPIEHERDEPVFHAPWEARVLALTLAVGAWGKWSIDGGRHARELIPGPDYLRMSYYEKWLEGLIRNMTEAGLVSAEEIASGRPASGSAKATPPLKPEAVAGVLAKGTPYTREASAPQRFKPGDRVRTKNINPTGHTRLPRYARARLGTVARHHGVHVFPDTNAHLQGEQPQHLYSVRFAARELWGAEASPRDAVHLDLWESYLEPA